jgi:hypothetical protein
LVVGFFTQPHAFTQTSKPVAAFLIGQEISFAGLALFSE